MRLEDVLGVWDGVIGTAKCTVRVERDAVHLIKKMPESLTGCTVVEKDGAVRFEGEKRGDYVTVVLRKDASGEVELAWLDAIWPFFVQLSRPEVVKRPSKTVKAPRRPNRGRKKKVHSFNKVAQAVRAGSVDRVKDFLRNGFDPRRQGIGGVTLLMEACRYKQLGVAARLLSSGASPLQLDRLRRDAVQYALDYSNPHRLPMQIEVPRKFGIERKHVKPDDPELRLALVKLLVDRGATLNPEKIETAGFAIRVMFTPPLSAAAELGDRDLIEWMLANGADVHGSDYDGMTALARAIIAGWPECVSVLLNAGADIHAIDGQRRNAFHRAAEFAASSRGKYLSKCRREEREPDAGHVAALCERYEAVMDIVIARGVAVDSQNERGWSPWDSAAVSRAADRTLEHMASLGADVNAPGARGTVLHLIAGMADGDQAESHRVARTLLRLGAEPDRRDSEGRTAADVAASLGRSELASLLSAG